MQISSLQWRNTVLTYYLKHCKCVVCCPDQCCLMSCACRSRVQLIKIHSIADAMTAAKAAGHGVPADRTGGANAATTPAGVKGPNTAGCKRPSGSGDSSRTAGSPKKEKRYVHEQRHHHTFRAYCNFSTVHVSSFWWVCSQSCLPAASAKCMQMILIMHTCLHCDGRSMHIRVCFVKRFCLNCRCATARC